MGKEVAMGNLINLCALSLCLILFLSGSLFAQMTDASISTGASWLLEKRYGHNGWWINGDTSELIKS